MKKICLFFLNLVLILGLVACGNDSNNIYTTSFKAKIIESNGSTVIVEPLENENIRRSADKISVEIGNIKKFVPEVLPVGTLVEIVYDGNINETYPAQINVLGFRTIMEENEIPTTIAYANWAENWGGLVSDENCLDADRFIYSDLPRLPLFKFDTKVELDEFVNKYKDIFTMEHGIGEIPSFNDVIVNYDDEFFKEHSLMLAYQEASSGSFRYGITKVNKENGTLVLRIEKLNNPEVFTDDMSGWFLMAEVEKQYIKDCTSFDAQLWGNYSGNITTIESNKIIIKNGPNDYDSINVGRIENFIENINNGINDEIEVTQYTIEGDPVVTTVRFNAIDRTFEVIKDNTQDKFGKPEIIKKEFDNSYKAVFGAANPNYEVKNQYYKFSLVSENNEEIICIFSY